MNTYTFILPLNSTEATLANVGGKGMNLAKMVGAGLPVPDGFLVTTSAYRAFVANNELGGKIAGILATSTLDDPTSLQNASTQIRALFANGNIPDSLRDHLRQAYSSFAITPLAIRSSATAEDLPDMSFAGQQDTYLNVAGESPFLEAVVSCWGSLWTARAIGYRTHNAIPHNDVALAIVAQEMVQSEASGVLFTANPLNGKRTETVIDATLGLGEALVSGLVEPDHYVVSTNSTHIFSKTIGEKATVIQSVAGGGVETITVPHDQQAIPDNVILDLVKMGQQTAKFFWCAPRY